MNFLSLIERKRDGHPLTAAQINEIIAAYIHIAKREFKKVGKTRRDPETGGGETFAQRIGGSYDARHHICGTCGASRSRRSTQSSNAPMMVLAQAGVSVTARSHRRRRHDRERVF